MASATSTSRASITLNWLGRTGAIASAAMLSLFVIGSIQSGDPMPTPTETVGIAFFPIGVVIGMLLTDLCF